MAVLFAPLQATQGAVCVCVPLQATQGAVRVCVPLQATQGAVQNRDLCILHKRSKFYYI